MIKLILNGLNNQILADYCDLKNSYVTASINTDDSKIIESYIKVALLFNLNYSKSLLYTRINIPLELIQEIQEI